jgi:cystathionine beta-lyase
MTATNHDFDDFSPATLSQRGSVKWSFYGARVLAAWVAEMDFAAAPPVRQAILDAVAREEFGYPLPDEISPLPEATATWEQRRYGWTVEPTRIHTVPDVLRGVELAVEQYSPTDSAVLLPTPAYMPFFEIPKAIRRPTVEVPTVRDEHGVRTLDYDRIDDAFAAGAGTIILCNPYNPLGRSFTVSELTDLVGIVDRHGGRVVADEIHAPLTYSGHRHVPYASISEAAADHSVTVVSASKAWNLAGLKCAQVILNSTRDDARWRSISLMRTHGASPIGVRANVAAYLDGGPWLDDLIVYLDGNRQLLAELLSAQLPAVEYTPPDATYLAWLDCRALELDVEPAQFFLDEAKVATNAGPAFGGDGAGHIRFKFATSKAILCQAVEAMAAAVTRHRIGP